MLPNRVDFLYVENFNGDVGESKCYRGVSNDALSYSNAVWNGNDAFGRELVELKILGLQESLIEKYHFEFLKKGAVKISWMNFADTLARSHEDYFCKDLPKYSYPISNYDVQESKTDDDIVVNVI